MTGTQQLILACVCVVSFSSCEAVTQYAKNTQPEIKIYEVEEVK